MNAPAATAMAQVWNAQAPDKTATEAAQRLQWSVIPLDADKRPCKTGGVHEDGTPKRIAWKKYQSQQAHSKQIDLWQKKFTPPAWAIITGAISKVVLLDFDGDRGRETLNTLGLDPHVQTGSGGYHVYFYHPGWAVKTLNSKSKLEMGQRWPGLDIRADGGYAAFCGHNEQGPYTWLRDFQPERLDILPAELRVFLGLMYSPDEAQTRNTPAPNRTQANSRDFPDLLLNWALKRVGYQGRDDTGFNLACQLRDNGIPEHEARSVMRAYAGRVPSTNTKGQIEAFTEEDALAKLESAYTRPARQPWDISSQKVGRSPAPAPQTSTSGGGAGITHITANDLAELPDASVAFVLDCLKQGEWGDSLLFAHLFIGKVIHDHTAKEWYTWCKHYWVLDDGGKIKGYVSGKLAGCYLRTSARIAEQHTNDDPEQKKNTDGVIATLTKRALDLRSVNRCRNILYFAESQEGMGITANQWDCNKWLLAVPNGVIDLKTGIRQDGQPGDYIRTVCPTEWQGLDTPAARFERFLQEIFEDRAKEERGQLLAFLARMFGYGITGEIREHIFTVLYGEDGRNGKDTLEGALSNALGQSSGVVSKDVLLDPGKQHSAGAATPHLSDLQGKRIAWASEPEKGARFNVGQVKDLSGGTPIPTRAPYEKRFYKFTPTHLLVLLTNHKPHADANDSAFWDRLRLITFNMRFVDNPLPGTNERKKDTTLCDTLASESAGILAWLVRGCLEWQKEGLNTPETVIQDGKAYRKEEDTIGLFVGECCTIENAGAETKSSRIYEAYSKWCNDGNMKPLNSTNFGKLLGKRFQKKPTMHGVFYQGIGLLAQSEQDMKGYEGSKANPSYGINPHDKQGEESQASKDNEGYEGFLYKNSNLPIENSPNDLVSIETLHTIHTPTQMNGVNPHDKPAYEAMNSFSNPSCMTTFESLMSTPHGQHEAALQDQAGNPWCAGCQVQHDLMNIGQARGYPAFDYDNPQDKRHTLKCKSGPDAWLQFCKTMGYVSIRRVLEVQA